MAELAERLNVSIATISNALTGKGRMRDERRQEILTAAKALGYDLAKLEKGQRKLQIDVIVEEFLVRFCQEIAEGISSAAERQNIIPRFYNMHLWDTTNPVMEDRERTRDLLKRYVMPLLPTSDGILYVSCYSRDLTNLMPRFDLPLVYSYGYTLDQATCVNCDDSQGAYLAMQHLISQGCRRIAMISGPIDSIPTNKRLVGYQRALLDNGLPFDPRLITVGEWSPENGFNAMKSLSGLSEVVDGIFCQSDHIANGVMRYALTHGIAIPKDIALTGFDNYELSSLQEIPLTSVAPPFVEIGEHAFDSLWKKIMHIPSQEPSIKLPCTLAIRQSSLRRKV